MKWRGVERRKWRVGVEENYAANMLEVIRKSILNDSEQFKTKLWALFFFDTPRWSRSPATPK